MEFLPAGENVWSIGALDVDGEPPRNDASFVEFVRTMPDPTPYDLLRSAQPISDIQVHQYRESRVIRYDQMESAPRGLVTLGDAFCSLDPDYTQGVTMAALGALTLKDCLLACKGQLDGLPRLFHLKLAGGAFQRPQTKAVLTFGECQLVYWS